MEDSGFAFQGAFDTVPQTVVFGLRVGSEKSVRFLRRHPNHFVPAHNTNQIVRRRFFPGCFLLNQVLDQSLKLFESQVIGSRVGDLAE